MSHKHSGDCKEIFAMLSEYLDAELPAQTCEEIRAHLADCPPCIEFLESLRRSVKLCRQYEAAETPGPISFGDKARLRDAFQKMLAKKAPDTSGPPAL